MRPKIGIIARPTMPEESSWLFVTEYYRKAIIQAGGNPFLILPVQDVNYNAVDSKEMIPMTDEEKGLLDDMLSLCDGIVMPGGYRMFEHDFYVLEYAIKNDVPILGICLGMQIMANYGRKPSNIKIDFESEEASKMQHDLPDKDYVHEIALNKKSKLYDILKVDNMMVNSRHKFEAQPSNIYETAAMSIDGVLEAVELPTNTFNIGVQWHPEMMYFYDENARMLIDAFLEHCKAYIEMKNS